MGKSTSEALMRVESKARQPTLSAMRRVSEYLRVRSSTGLP